MSTPVHPVPPSLSFRLRLQEAQVAADAPDSPLSAQITLLRTQWDSDPDAARPKLAEMLKQHPQNHRLLLMQLEDVIVKGDHDTVNAALAAVMAVKGAKPYWLARYMQALRDGWIDHGPLRLAVDPDIINPWILRFMAMGSYEAQEVDLLSQTLTDDDSVVELGAGIGFMGLMTHTLAPNARYRGAEANPALFDMIHRNLAFAGAPDLDIRNEVLGLETGEVSFHVSPRYWSSSLLPEQTTREITVPAHRLEDALRTQEASYLVMDIEGSEYALLPHVDLSGVQKILIEMHPDKVTRAQHSDAVKSMLNAGFELDGDLSRRNVLFLARAGANAVRQTPITLPADYDAQARTPPALHPELTLLKAAAPADHGPNDVTVYLCARNEARNLPHFFDYYRALGARRFVVVDNQSTDASQDFLRAQDDTFLYEAAGNYRAAGGGLNWIHSVMDTHDLGGWILLADADELLVYPACEHLPLSGLTQVLEDSGARGLYTFMLDCYGDAPAQAQPYVPGEAFLTHAPYFDGKGYVATLENDPTESPDLRMRGGVRHRFFDWKGSEGLQAPNLKKVPLVKNHGGGVFLGPHRVRKMPLCGMTGALLHFKFLGRDMDHVKEDIAHGGRGSTQPYFEAYVNALDGAPETSFMYDHSTRYVDSFQLIDLGLITLSQQAQIAVSAALKPVMMNKARSAVFTRLKAAREGALGTHRSTLGQALTLLDRF